nr:hypothetical protein [uncultured Cohaesibacter sp.]
MTTIKELGDFHTEQINRVMEMNITNEEKERKREQLTQNYLAYRQEYLRLAEHHWSASDNEQASFNEAAQKFGALTLRAAYISNAGMLAALVASPKMQLSLGSLISFLLGVTFAFAATGVAYLSQFLFSQSIQCRIKLTDPPYIVEDKDGKTKKLQARGSLLLWVAIVLGFCSFLALCGGLIAFYVSYQPAVPPSP